jgi:hypothetical protein
MAHHPTSLPTWDTASLGRPASTSALKHSALSTHLSDCGARRGRLHDLQSAASGLGQLLTARVMTTVLVISLLLGASWLLR